jgi:hypothetical protein
VKIGTVKKILILYLAVSAKVSGKKKGTGLTLIHVFLHVASRGTILANVILYAPPCSCC